MYRYLRFRGHFLLLSLLLTFSHGVLSATLYYPSDTGSSSTDTSWRIIDANPTGAEVVTIADATLNREVTQTSSTATQNAFRIGGTSSSNGWNNTDEFVVSWSLKSNGNYNVYVRVDTSLGWRYLYYNQSNKNNLLNSSGRYIHHGLGTSSKDGHWHTWSRDLTADLANAEPENILLAVHGITLRGSVSITNVYLGNTLSPVARINEQPLDIPIRESITLNATGDALTSSTIVWSVDGVVQAETDQQWSGSFETAGTKTFLLEVDDGQTSSIETTSVNVVDNSTPTVYSDAQDNTLDGWAIRDNTPEGALLENVPADSNGGRAIKTTSSNLQNAFLLGSVNTSGESWRNSTQSIFSFRAKASDNFRVYVRVMTLDGWRYLWYDPRDNNLLHNSNGRYIHHGLGTDAKNDEWVTIYRDLNADLQAVESDNQVTEVYGVLVRGSMLITDVQLMARLPDATEPEPIDDQAPLATFTSSTLSGVAPLTLNLDASESTDNIGIVSYNWSFGDGQTTQSAQPFVISHTYAVEGSYTASLTVTDLAGNTASTLQTINVIAPNQAPTAIFTATVDQTNPLLIHVDAGESTDDAGISSYTWQYADGSEAMGMATSLLFADAGIKNISLQVRDEQGLFDESIQTVTLNLPVPAVPINLTPQPDAIVDAGSTQTFIWSADPLAASFDFHFFDRIDGSLTFINDIDPTIACQDASCQLQQLIELPVHANHAWRVRARNASGVSGWSRSEFDIVEPVSEPPQTPELITPSNDMDIMAPSAITFLWAPADTASEYDLEVIDSQQNTVVSHLDLLASNSCSTSQCTFTSTLDLAANDNYTWRVRAKNAIAPSLWASSSFNVIEPDTSIPEEPVNLTPVATSTLVENTAVTFSWQATEHATYYDFHFFDNETKALTFTNAIDPTESCDETVCTLTTPVALPVFLNHAWRVRAGNSLGVSSWSRNLFNVIAAVTDAPDLPENISPAVGAQLFASSDQVFTWTHSASASSYDFHFFDSFSGEQTYITGLDASSLCDATLCEFSTLVDLPIGNEHAWRVRAINGIGRSEWSRSVFSVVPDTDTTLQAFFSLSTQSGFAPLSVSFDASASTAQNGIVSYDWQFDEDSRTEGPEAIQTAHVFDTAGSYSVTLTVTNDAGLTDSYSASISVIDPATIDAVSSADAARLLAQASFGASSDAIAEVQLRGVAGWIEHQFNLQGAAHLDYVTLYSNGSNRTARHEVWWRDAVDGEDQLRSRVAYALSQLFVISDTGFTLSNAQFGVTHYYDQLREMAFSNYRDLLETVTLSPVMGIYLSMLQNQKADSASHTRADENYAREVLQLFSIGLYNLNQDGSSTNENAFTQAQVEDFARVFTGWNYKNAGRWDRPLFTNQDLINPMEPFEQFHDTGSKSLLLGQDIPAGLTAKADLDMALDNIFNHPNVGPFVGKHLIQQLVTSNPSPAYIERVASAFNDNGAGVRGDLKAVVRQILMDDEARSNETAPHFGKLREPVMRLAHLWRAFKVKPGNQSVRNEYNTYTPWMENLETVTGQAVLRSPSVFNFYQPEHAPAGAVQNQGLVAPVFQIFTDSNLLATATRINNQIHRHFAANPNSVELNPSYVDFSVENTLASNTDALLDHLNILLLSGSMSDGLRSVLSTHLNALESDDTGLKQRARDAVSLIVASPEYLVQK